MQTETTTTPTASTWRRVARMLSVQPQSAAAAAAWRAASRAARCAGRGDAVASEAAAEALSRLRYAAELGSIAAVYSLRALEAD